jgi:hypothetical protein
MDSMRVQDGLQQLSSSEELAGDRGPFPAQEGPRVALALPPDKLHPTLSSWLKNISKLDGLINRLQDLASSAPTDHRSQLLNKVAALRATFKKQQERCIEFLQLNEDYANKYLLNIDAEVRQQSVLLDNLEERLEAAKKLHGDAVDLQMLYESGTVASMNDFCATGKAVPRFLRRLQGKLLGPSIFRYFAAASTGQSPVSGGWLRDG